MTFREMLVRIAQNGRLVAQQAKLKTKKVFAGHKTSENVKFESETSRNDEARSLSIGRQVEFRIFDRLVCRGRHQNSTKLGERLSKLRRNSALRFNPGVARNTTLLGLLGVSFGAQQYGTTEKDSLDSVCFEIQNLFGREHQEPLAENQAYSLKDISFGKLIAKGCHAAVYEAKLKRTIDSEVNAGHVGLNLISRLGSNNLSTITEEPLEFVDDHFSTEPRSDSDESFEFLSDPHLLNQNSNGVDACNLDQRFDLAVKVMFNYDTESNVYAILQAMKREIVPARHADSFSDMDTWENGTHVRQKLPAHPNVVDMRLVLVGDTPLLTSAIEEFPAALPQRLCSSGCARNKTMFIVMKRYPQTLRDYLHQHLPQPRESTLLLAQLLEAVCHLDYHQVAHRDLKSDNILVEFTHEDSPSLVVTDFGCCLSEGCLQVQFSSYEVPKGGNAALMAPEISLQSPGVGVILDFTRSDVWAAGALAYEMFGMINPFYKCKQRARLDSRYYKQSDLPPLPLHVPEFVKKVVNMLLARCPSERPSAAVAANMLYLGLWAPHLLNKPPSKADVITWLAHLTLDVIGQRLQDTKPSVELLLKKMFLSRLNMNDIFQALHLLSNEV